MPPLVAAIDVIETYGLDGTSATVIANVERLIAAEEAHIVEVFGAHDSQTDELPGLGDFIFLGRKATSITSVTEITEDGLTETVLSPSDYGLRHQGWALLRKRQPWEHHVIVEYVPESDLVRRRQAVIDLVGLALRDKEVRGKISERIGDYSYTLGDREEIQKQRGEILSRLITKQRLFA